VLEIFEKVFNHKAFTGRSGTFFAYEGLGSIYWHMVSKLHLAVQECCLKAIDEKADPVVMGNYWIITTRSKQELAYTNRLSCMVHSLPIPILTPRSTGAPSNPE
jgi:hypothetical protein